MPFAPSIPTIPYPHLHNRKIKASNKNYTKVKIAVDQLASSYRTLIRVLGGATRFAQKVLSVLNPAGTVIQAVTVVYSVLMQSVRLSASLSYQLQHLCVKVINALTY